MLPFTEHGGKVTGSNLCWC